MPTPMLVSALAALTLTGPAALAAQPGPVTLTAEVPLVCGHPTGTFSFALPASAEAPAHIAPTAVALNGARAAKVTVTGRTVAVTAARPRGVTCMSITVGTLTLRLAAGAGVTHARTARATTVALHRGTQTFRARLTFA